MPLWESRLWVHDLVQLATLIHTHNIGPNSKEKALSLLDEIASYNSYARMVRAAITNGIEINQNVEIDSALDKTPKVGAMLEESDEFVFTKPFVNGHSFGIPKSVILNARLRKLKFEMDFGTKLSAEQALVEIEVINEANEGSYLTFISERYGSCGDLEDDSGQGAALLVKAFENVDLGLITEACEMVPRFSAVAELARSVIVTGEVANDNDGYGDDVRNAPWERVFVRRIRRSKLARSLRTFSGNQSDHVSKFSLRSFEDIVGALVTIESIAA